MLLSKFKSKRKVETLVLALCFLPILFCAQNKVSFIKYSNLYDCATSNISYHNGKIISQVSGQKINIGGNNSYGQTVVYTSNLDTFQTTVMAITTSTNSSFLNLQSERSFKPTHYGLSFSYKQGYLSTILFKPTGLLIPDTAEHKAYASKNYRNRITRLYQLKDSSFVGSSIMQTQILPFPYKFGLWWLDKNLDTVRNVYYDFNLWNSGGCLLRNIYELPKKDLLLGGYSDSLDAFDGLVMRVDSLGAIKFARSIGTDSSDQLNFIKVKNSYYLYGNTKLYNDAGYDFNRLLLIKVDTLGNVIYAKVINNGEGNLTLTANAVQFNDDLLWYGSQSSLISGNNQTKSIVLLMDTNGVVKKYHKTKYTPVTGTQNPREEFTNAVLDSIKNVYLHYFYYNNSVSNFQTGLVKLDSNLIGCIPSIVQSFTTTDVTNLVHSVPINYTVKRDSLIRVKGTITQTYGVPGIVEDCSAYVGVKEYVIQNQFVKLYPNPANEIINVELEILNDKEELIIYNTIGQVVYQTKINTLQSSFNIQHLSSGMYFIKIINQQTVLFNSKINVIK